MTLLTIAPAPIASGRFHLTTIEIVIIAVIAVIGLIVIIGWRAPDRSPGIEKEAERERIDD